MVESYYIILGSLPHLPYFERAERLPITRLRLQQRIGMLPALESEQLYQAEDLVGLRSSLAERRTHAVMTRRYRAALMKITQPALREFVEFRIDEQSVLAALRLRRTGWVPGRDGNDRGAGSRVRYIEAHWNEPDFRLAFVFPWIPAVRKCLDEDDARGLDRLLLEINWRVLSRIADRDPLGFGGIVAFLFKWDILNAWLARDAAQATRRFQALIGEVKHGQ